MAKIHLAFLFCILHLSWGSLLEETFDFDVRGRTRTRKDLTTGCIVSESNAGRQLDIRVFDGQWYEIFRSKTKLPIFFSGVWNFQKSQDSQVSNFIFAPKLQSKQCMPSINGKIRLSLDKPSTLILDYDGLKGHIKEELKVIHTDNKNRIDLYGCLDRNAQGQCFSDSTVVIVLSRYPTLSQPVLDNMKQMISKNACISPASLLQQDTKEVCILGDTPQWDRIIDENSMTCRKTSPCTVACPEACEENDNGCIICSSKLNDAEKHDKQALVNEELKRDGCILNANECPDPNCILAEKTPGCLFCDCKLLSMFRSPIDPNKVFAVDDIRSCPSTCRSRDEHHKIMCDCSNQEICRPVPAGVPNSCPGKEERYYFDHKTGTCHAFYGSCLGDVNNFRTLKDCIDTCADICELPLDTGKCPTYEDKSAERYYFNRNRGVCDKFRYSGCGGNANNFVTRSICKNKCPEWMKDGGSNPRPEKCLLKSERGNCEKSDIRYFFLQVTRTCTSFFYSGCGGNANNFHSLEECEHACRESAGKNPSQCLEIKDCPCPLKKVEDKCDECPCLDDDDGAFQQKHSTYFILSCLIMLTLAARWQH